MIAPRYVGLLCLVALSACEPVEEPIAPAAPQLLVQAVLDAGSRTQIILVDRTQTGIPGNLVAIADAVVELVTPQGVVMRAGQFINTLDSSKVPGLYGVDLAKNGVFRLTPGGTYTLKVTVPGATGPVSGQTTVPGPDAPMLLPPRPTLNRLTDTLRLSWPRAAGAAAYQVTVDCEISALGGTFHQIYSFFADTSIVLAGTARTLDNQAVFFASSAATVIVNAVDQNYYGYYHATTDPFAGAPPTKLSSGVGVFGSISPVLQVSFPVR